MFRPCVQPRWFPAGLLAVALAACHDAPRDNPFDPELTPAVELEVALDDTAGTATLKWKPYEGETLFAAYWVLRKVSGLEKVDTLAAIGDVGITSLVDANLRPNLAYSYRVSVVNTSGFEVASEDVSIEGYVGGPVHLFEPEVDPQGESVTLRWNRFTGGKFEAYRVERFSLDVFDFEEIGRNPNVGDTLFFDFDPVLEASRYRIVVEAAGETWSSDTSGRVRLSSPAVVLRSVDFDEREGTATLTWSRYAGESFLSYQIERRIAGESSADLHETIDDANVTSFVDTEVEAGRLYIYSVAVFISTSGAELPGDAMEASFALEPPQLQVEFDRENASATLSWTHAVSGFEQYEIHRRSLRDNPLEVVHFTTTIDDTTFVNTVLEENTQYIYTVVTRSTDGKEVESAPVSGPTFTVDLPGGGTMEFVWIEPGTFAMGSPESERGRERVGGEGGDSNEGPQHEVTISQGFYLGQFEITQGQWEAVMGTTPWSGQDFVRSNPDHPAVYISWNDMQAFIERLNEAEGEELYRLPTEAEWEYAARAGTTTRWSFGEDESPLGDYAWYRENAWNAGEQYGHKVGTKLLNPWGLYDMHGNVGEWCQDRYIRH